MATPLCLRNLSKYMIGKKTGLNGYVYDFIVDHDAISAVNDILDIHNYLTKKIDIV